MSTARPGPGTPNGPRWASLPDEEDYVVAEIPAIFGRIGPKALEPLRGIAAVPGGDWTLRHSALCCMAAIALRHPGHEEYVFRLIGIVAGDEREDEDIRVWAGDILLDFGRNEHRELLFGLADSGMSRPLYGRRAIRRRLKQPCVARYHRNWMRFYESRELARRRCRAEQDRLTTRQAWDEALSAPWGECPGSGDDPLPDPCDGPQEPCREAGDAPAAGGPGPRSRPGKPRSRLPCRELSADPSAARGNEPARCGARPFPAPQRGIPARPSAGYRGLRGPRYGSCARPSISGLRPVQALRHSVLDRFRRPRGLT